MANARLHIICGNCGCNDEFVFEYDSKAQLYGDGTYKGDVAITCKNCSTIHWLTDNAKQEDNA